MSHQAQQVLPPAAGEVVLEEGKDQFSGLVPWVATWIILLSISAVINAGLVVVAHGAHGFFLPVLATVVCILAALFDGWTQRIPNQLTYTTILLGVGLNALHPVLEYFHLQTAVIWLGSSGLTSSVGGFLICAFLGLAGSLLAGVHGGDLKLLAAIGAIAGFWNTCNITMLALLFALFYGVINLALFGRLNLVLRVAAHRMLEFVYVRRFQTEIPDGVQPTHTPMAVPLAVAAIAVIYLQLRYGTGGIL